MFIVAIATVLGNLDFTFSCSMLYKVDTSSGVDALQLENAFHLIYLSIC